MSQTLITMDDAALGYAGRVVLTVPSLRVAPGQMWCVLGDNGSGKSTLLAALVGNLRASSGGLHRDGCNIGYLPQLNDAAFALPLRVREYVELGLPGTRAAPGFVDAALERARAAGLADLSFASLSGGQRRRAALARALVRKPNLLIADEPEAGLDASTRAGVLADLEAMRDADTGVIVATHDSAWAEAAATHILELRDGKAEVRP